MDSNKTDFYNDLFKENCSRTRNIYNKLKELNNMKKIEISNDLTQKNTINNNITLYNNISKEIISGFDSDSYCSIIKDDILPTNKIIETTKNILEEGPEFINQNNLEQYNNFNSSKYQFLDNIPDNVNKNFLFNNSYSDKSFLY
jgi:hypothetical protein